MIAGRDRRDPRAGVTLLELMLSLALMAAMALAIATVLGLTGRAAQRIGAAGGAADLLLARHALREWIEAAPRTAALEGSAEVLRFETLTDEPPFTAADPATVTLALDGNGAVVAQIATTGGGTTQSMTLSPSGRLRIAYYGRVGATVAPAWRGDWPAAAGLPDLVRIDYDGPEGGAPPLTVIPALLARQSEMSLSSPLPPS